MGPRLPGHDAVVRREPAAADDRCATCDLARHGYHVYPQGPYFVPYPDGRSLQLPTDPRVGATPRSPSFSARDADAMERWDAWLRRPRRGARAAAHRGPAAARVHRARATCWPRPRLAWRLRRLGVRGVADVTRLFSMSIADLLDDFFESPELQGVLSVSGVIGTWAGPRSPGTAFVMAHHQLGDVGDGRARGVGVPRGRHGRA